jgi:hypothetical protein
VLLFGACNFHDGVKPALDDAHGEIDAQIDIDAAPPDTQSATCLDRWHAGTIHFSAPQKLGGVNSPQLDRDDFLTSDELTIYWGSERAPGAPDNGEVWTASRAAKDLPFTGATRFMPANTGGYESKLGITDDGLYFVVASSQPMRDADLYDARRTSTGMAFPPPDNTARLSAVNVISDQLDPFITSDGLHLYYAQSLAVQQIYSASRASLAAAWSAGAPVPGVSNGTDGDADPAVSQDQLIILFASNRAPAGIVGNVWYATRASTSATFGAPKQVPDIGVTGATDGDPWLSPDGCRLYFASTRDLAANNVELYVATAN